MQNFNNNPQEINQTYKQPNFIGFENFIELENQVSQTKEKSKLSKIGKKLPRISSQECFKFDRNQDFSIQRNKLDRYGASEVGIFLLVV
uniref:Uncharacterized protein n=1 Tax=Borreliella burgdorferi TaxID=139 RepID=Q44709_BORBG|nr:unknown [Borreliella burgdorferi]